MAQRATTTVELEQVLARLFPDDPGDSLAQFRLQASDVVVAPFSKCGTTWLQQICHGLRTGGSMDFDEISAVVPWIETCHQFGWDPDAPQVASPRVFKSHAPWDQVTPGGRYIVALREPEAAFLSLYRFFAGWLFAPGSISLEDFFAWRCAPLKLVGMGYWHHLLSWWQQRQRADVLLLCYEDMVANPEATVRRVAEFIAVPLDQPLLDLVLAQSSKGFMLDHAAWFDERYLRRYGEQHAGLPAGGDAHKVTDGGGGRVAMTALVREGLARLWTQEVASQSGLADYAALRATLTAL